MFLTRKTGKVQIEHGIDLIVMRISARYSCNSCHVHHFLFRLSCERKIIVETVTDLYLKNIDVAFGCDNAPRTSFGRSWHECVHKSRNQHTKDHEAVLVPKRYRRFAHSRFNLARFEFPPMLANNAR